MMWLKIESVLTSILRYIARIRNIVWLTNWNIMKKTAHFFPFHLGNFRKLDNGHHVFSITLHFQSKWWCSNWSYLYVVLIWKSENSSNWSTWIEAKSERESFLPGCIALTHSNNKIFVLFDSFFCLH